MRIMVMSGASFFGLRCAHMLWHSGHPVTVLDTRTYTGRREKLKGISAHHIVGASCVPRAAASTVQCQYLVIHAATEDLFIHINIDDMRTIHHAADWKGVERCRFQSEDKAFGTDPVDTGFAPDHPHRPGDGDAAGKSGVKALVHARHHTHPCTAFNPRCLNSYGSRQHTEQAILWRTRASLGWTPQFQMVDGIAQPADGFQEQRSLWN